ncbi:MAG: hypothetical protein ACRD4L_08690, partial [Pyrinomonadaceae bacterium]
SKSQDSTVATEDFLNPSIALADAPPPRPSQKIYSITGVLGDREKTFAGQFETPGRRHDFAYTMNHAALEGGQGGKLVLTGTLAVTTYTTHKGQRRSGMRSDRTVKLENVRATLVSTQGGVGSRPTAPMRPQPSSERPQNGPSPASEHKENQTEKVSRPPLEAFSEGSSLLDSSNKESSIPITSATGKDSFVAAMFLRLQPLDGNRLLGISADIATLQLNARFAGVNDSARRLHLYFSDLILNAFGENRDESAAVKNLEAINQELA